MTVGRDTSAEPPTPSVNPALPAADIAAAIEVINRFTLSADARDWGTAIGCLHDFVDFTAQPAQPAATIPAFELVEQIKSAVLRFDATQHLVTNHVVASAPDGMTCTVSFRYEHLRDGRCWTLGGRQEYRLARAAISWQITGIAMRSTWQHGDRSLVPAP